MRKNVLRGTWTGWVARERTGAVAGLVIARRDRRWGWAVHVLYLRPGHRSRRAFPTLFRELAACEGRPFSLDADLPGVGGPRRTAGILPPGWALLSHQRLRRSTHGVPEPRWSLGRARLRPLRRSDRDGVARLAVRAYRGEVDEVMVLHQRSGRGTAIAYFARTSFAPSAHLLPWASWVVEGPQGLLGAVVVHRNRNEVGISNLVVDPRFRRRGWGSALLRSALRSSAEHGLTQAKLLVTCENATRALEIYRRLGFRPYRRAGAAPSLWVDPRVLRALGTRHLPLTRS